MAITATKPRANARKTTNSFWWADLQSTDVKASLTFYGRVLGWDFRDESDESGAMVYHTANIGGVKLAGLGQLQDQAMQAGMPSMWTSYVTVADVDATCAKATQLGGTVMMPAMDVMDQGRMAIIVDPTGAAFGIWQNGRHDGADAVNQPSTLIWTELYSSDVEASRTFYRSLLGWESAPMEGSDSYWLFELDGRQFAGLMKKPAEMGEMPDSWLAYFGVADVDATKAEVEAAGGEVVFGPMQTGPGRTIGVRDPQGGFIHLMQLDEWPAD